MIKSMTGYASAEKTDGDLTVSIDIRTYNSRYLDLSLRVPSNYAALEEKVKGLITERIIRGRVEVKVQIKDASNNAMEFEIDRPRTKAIYAALSNLNDEFGLKDDISMETLLGVGGIIRPVETAGETDTIWPAVEACFIDVLDELETMRKKEGDFIARDLSTRLDYIGQSIDAIKSDSDGLLSHYQERLKERITALTREIVDIDSGRLAQEAAFLADRSDISEEIVRAESHVKQFRHIMLSRQPGGRKLNFLLQELHREFNTMGSKLGHVNISHRVVEIKSELEKIREQIQNVE